MQRLDSVKRRSPSLVGLPRPTLVFANEKDLAYGSFPLDPRSRESILEGIGDIDDPLLRMGFVNALWETVREAELSPEEHLRVLLALVEREIDPLTATRLLDQAVTAVWKYIPRSSRSGWSQRFTTLARRKAWVDDTARPLALAFFRSLTRFPTDDESADLFIELLEGRKLVFERPLSPKDRWSLVTALLRDGHSRAEDFFQREVSRDKSPDAARYAYIASAARHGEANKATSFESFLDVTEPPERWVADALETFNAPGQESPDPSLRGRGAFPRAVGQRESQDLLHACLDRRFSRRSNRP